MHKQIILLSWLSLTSGACIAETRDPTQPGDLPPATIATQGSSTQAPIVTEIFISETSRRAIVNGSSVKAGDTLDENTRVLRIQPRYILIRQNGINKKIYLVPTVKTR